MLAYLVIREGSKWTDVFRLVAGRTVTIGRAPTNQIVIKDERCSRHHAELFLNKDRWVLRDLESRNGTMIGNERVEGDRSLTPGEVIRIAHAQLAFVNDLSEAFPDSHGPKARGVDDETVLGQQEDDSSVLTGYEPTMITHRRGQTKFLAPSLPEEEVSATPKVGRAAAKLCRLAFELANQGDANQVAELALRGLFESTSVDAGAVLLLPRDFTEIPSGSELEVVAARSDSETPYHRVSDFLATMVMREGEAVLARNVEDDSTLGSRDSQGEIHATSVVWRPFGKKAAWRV